MFQGSFSASQCGSRSALLRYIMTPFAKAISIGPFLSNMCSLKHWISIYSTEKKKRSIEESEVSTFCIRRSHSFGITCLHQSSNSKLVGQAAVLKNRELDSVGSENSWQLSSWVTQDLANNTVPLYLWVVPPSQFASHHDFYIVIGNPKLNLDLPRVQHPGRPWEQIQPILFAPLGWFLGIDL